MEMYRKNDIYTRNSLKLRGLTNLKTILRKQLIVRRIGAAP